MVITPDELKTLKAWASGGGLVNGVPALDLLTLVQAAELLACLRRYEYLVASDYRAHTGRSLNDDLTVILGPRP